MKEKRIALGWKKDINVYIIIDFKLGVWQKLTLKLEDFITRL